MGSHQISNTTSISPATERHGRNKILMQET